GSTASGAATALAVRGAPGASGLVIDVDTDDGLIDSITVRAEVTIDFYDESYSFRNGPINIVLNDEPTLYGFVPPGAGVGLGTANGAYAMGVFGGSGGIGMGGAPVITMEVGETIILPLTH